MAADGHRDVDRPQVFETFPYSAIIKWLPAESRTHNPGKKILVKSPISRV